MGRVGVISGVEFWKVRVYILDGWGVGRGMGFCGGVIGLGAC